MNEKYIVTWDLLQIYTRKLAQRLLPASRWQGLIVVSRGGLVPGAILARELALRYVDTLCISSYDHDHQRELKIIKRADSVKDGGKGFIVIDDLVDTGKTAEVVRDLYPHAYFVTVFAKPAGRSKVDDYILDIEQNVWIEQPWDMSLTFTPPLSK